MIVCENSGHTVNNDFPEARKIIEAGATSKPVVDEDLPTPEKSIQQIEKEQMVRLKKKAKNGKLMLDE